VNKQNSLTSPLKKGACFYAINELDIKFLFHIISKECFTRKKTSYCTASTRGKGEKYGYAIAYCFSCGLGCCCAFGKTFLSFYAGRRLQLRLQKHFWRCPLFWQIGLPFMQQQAYDNGRFA
jgi:hypothetical protein